MTEEQQQQANIECFKITVMSLFPKIKDITHNSDFISHTFLSRVEIGEHEGDSVMVTMFPNGQYWITNFAKLNDGSVVTMGQRITYSESEMLAFLKRVKTFLESGDWK